MQIPSCMIGKVTINPALYNGAGTIKKVEDVKEAARCEATGAILVGSITVEERQENPIPNFWIGPTGSINSWGIPNPGKSYYRRHLPEMAKIAHDAGKPLFLSEVGFTPAEFGELAEVAAEGGADGVELNFGCMNIWDGGIQKRCPSFLPDVIGQILEHVRRIADDLVIMAKFSHYSDPFLLKEVAEVIKVHGVVHAVTTCNTSPNAYGEDKNGRPLIKAGGGLGGFGGFGFKNIALGQVVQWRAALPRGIAVIGVGGISSGEDMAEYFRYDKVVAVQVATALLTKHHLDLHILDRFLLEFSELPEQEPETAA